MNTGPTNSLAPRSATGYPWATLELVNVRMILNTDLDNELFEPVNFRFESRS